jgi:cation transport protein ChaC
MPNTSINQSPPPADAFKRWTEVERQASLEETLNGWQETQDVWIFGYGSLIWRPEFDFTESRLARLDQHHRALCLWSRINRGTPEVPGLVFGLEQGGEGCGGMVFRIPAQKVRETFASVWIREMSTGAYYPRWRDCQTDQGIVSALTFVINPEAISYVSEPSEDELVSIVLRAQGIYGSCFDYVMQTAVALRQAGICDERLARLADRLALQQQSLAGTLKT